MPVAVSCCADPAAALLSGGLTEIDASCGAVAVLLPEPDASQHPPSALNTAIIAKALIEVQENETRPAMPRAEERSIGEPQVKTGWNVFLRIEPHHRVMPPPPM